MPKLKTNFAQTITAGALGRNERGGKRKRRQPRCSALGPMANSPVGRKGRIPPFHKAAWVGIKAAGFAAARAANSSPHLPKSTARER